MIKTLAELRATRVFAFPTKRKQFEAAVRSDGSIVAVDRTGKLFFSGFHERRGRSIGSLQRWQALRIIAGLQKLGVLALGVGEELKAEDIRERLREDARSLLAHASDLEALGCPFTKEQLKKLETIRDEQ